MKKYILYVDQAELNMIFFGLKTAKDMSNDLFRCGNQIPDKTYSKLLVKLNEQYGNQSK